jgi:hypothetical protein
MKKNKSESFRKRIPGRPLKRGEWAGNICVNIYDRDQKRVAFEIWSYEEDGVRKNGEPICKLIEKLHEEEVDQ